MLATYVYVLAISWLPTCYGIAIMYLLADPGLVIPWPWAGYGLAFGYQLAMD